MINQKMNRSPKSPKDRLWGLQESFWGEWGIFKSCESVGCMINTGRVYTIIPFARAIGAGPGCVDETTRNEHREAQVSRNV